MKRMRGAVLWLAAIFVIATSALGYAQVGENHGSDVSAVAKPTAPPQGSDHGKAVSEVANGAEVAAEDADSESGERKLNHGFYVSQAAQCEDVDDPETEASPDFTAPEDCTGASHGEYVSSVAKSSAGKKAKKNAE
ncbi:MAG: hypothetical protein ACRDKG_12535 [Actinomycetota bacterium]